MNVQVTGPFVYFTIPLFGGIPITQTTVSSCIVTAALCIAAICLGKRLQKRPEGIQVLLEKGVMMLNNMVISTMGAHNAHWTPFIITLFVSSIGGSLIGMTGFLRATTADLSTTLAWAVMVTALIWYHNIKNKGFLGWLKGFAEPVAVMTPMNLISEIAQPVSMAFRHFGNIAGGGVITAILYAALSLLSNLLRLHIPVAQLGLPAVLSVYFDVFSAFVQALVFSLLSMVYISAACPPRRNTSV